MNANVEKLFPARDALRESIHDSIVDLTETWTFQCDVVANAVRRPDLLNQGSIALGKLGDAALCVSV